MTTTHQHPPPPTTGTDHHPARWGIVALAFLTILLDGYDTAALGFAVPTIAEQWNLDESAFTPALAITNLGVVIGYLCSGRAAARFGHKHLVVTGTAAFAAGSALTAPADTMTTLCAARLLTALGLGIVLPSCVALAADNVPPARRETVSIAVVLAIAVGAVIGGLASTPLVETYGWTSLFWAGAALPALLVPLLARGLPSDPTPRTTAPTHTTDPAIRRLFAHGTAKWTILLWCLALLMYATNYALLTWLPTLLTRGYGFTAAQAPIGVSMIATGGVLGGLILIPLCSRFGTARALAAMVVAGAAFLITAAQADASRTILLALLTAAGAGIVAGVLGQTALAVALYPTTTRTTGIACAAALGRIGSIIGPAACGGLLALDIPSRTILLLSALPVTLGAVLAFTFVLRAHRTAKPARPDSE
ncbi:MFS transporter [Streptomyces indicus]|uniref:MFS transporter, AAHS family, 4-hydroxybenzoate transporter n=1 Tax=Streptomyces indicus TaxID=417292 RepID=A0A1G9JRM0_9ACTN|nr:MFS transporter [Streptomyces indicus]SDL39583.1 MFS transporter, AAHS family, 4-hydroxybenzoate transporter [Streptomyces indicus]